MDYIAAALELIALWMIGNKIKWAFLVNVVGLSLWIYVALTRNVYGLFVSVIPGIAISLYNFYKWRKD